MVGRTVGVGRAEVAAVDAAAVVLVAAVVCAAVVTATEVVAAEIGAEVVEPAVVVVAGGAVVASPQAAKSENISKRAKPALTRLATLAKLLSFKVTSPISFEL
jgi:hypothetical protein